MLSDLLCCLQCLVKVKIISDLIHLKFAPVMMFKEGELVRCQLLWKDYVANAA